MQDMNVETGAHGCLCILDQFSVSVIGTVLLCIRFINCFICQYFVPSAKHSIPEMLEYNLMHDGWCAEIVF